MEKSNQTIIPWHSNPDDVFNSDKLYWKYVFNIPKSKWTLRGNSRSAVKTGFYIKELGVMLDAGINSYFDAKFILITHSHSDHTQALPAILIDCSDALVIAPKEELPLIEKYVNAFYSMNAGDADVACWKLKTKGVSYNEKFDLSNDVHIVTYRCFHGKINSLAYGFQTKKTKLKEQYLGLKGGDIAQLRKSGVDVTETYSSKEFIYVGDTTIECLQVNSEIFEYRNIMLECTFLTDDDMMKGDLKKEHMHWGELIPYIQKHKDCLFILYHFSKKYLKKELEDFFTDQFSKYQLTNVKPWI